MSRDESRDALVRARKRLIGQSPARIKEALDQLRSKGATRDGIRGFGVVPSDGESAETLRILVRKKLRPAEVERRGFRAVPHRIGGLRTEVLAATADVANASPGAAIKLATGASVGSLTYIVDRNGQRNAVSASHVIAVPVDQPQQGDSVWVDNQPSGTLHAWLPLAPFATVTADVAVARTTLPATTNWPDGRVFSGTRDYDPLNGPFTFFGHVSGARSGSGDSITASTIALDVPDVGPVLYAGHALVAASSTAGDSGAALCDASGFLVGMVVGATQTGRSCVTPWQSLGPALELILA